MVDCVASEGRSEPVCAATPVNGLSSGILPGRVLLGTAQIGMAYGRRRNEAPLGPRQVDRLLATAWELGIRAYDTAEAYGDAPDAISRWLRLNNRLEGSAIVTKVAPKEAIDESRVMAACRKFESADSITVLSHGAIGTQDFARLEMIAMRVGAAEAGQSVYSAEEVSAAVRAGAVRVQAPVNVLDTRQLVEARRSNVNLDARSVFLQGLLLEAPEVAERRVCGAGLVVRGIRSAAAALDLAPATALLAGVLLQLGPADRVVVGSDSPEQLGEIVAATSVPVETVVAFLAKLRELGSGVARSPKLLDPRMWS
jgi:aryl-alcohol dehydrogenase-like predicted oxidoreductase